MNRRFITIFAAVAAAASVQAQSTEAVTFTGGTLANNTITAGWTFSIASGTSIKITHLGWYDINATGNTWNNVPVKIWNRTTAAELASASILNTNPKESSGFRYASLANPLTLGAGNYVIGGFGKNYMVGATAVTPIHRGPDVHRPSARRRLDHRVPHELQLHQQGVLRPELQGRGRSGARDAGGARNRCGRHDAPPPQELSLTGPAVKNGH